jgi:hypothetical protein
MIMGVLSLCAYRRARTKNKRLQDSFVLCPLFFVLDAPHPPQQAQPVTVHDRGDVGLGVAAPR